MVVSLQSEGHGMGMNHTFEEGMLTTEFHQISADEALARLRSDHGHGLSDAEAHARLQQHGPNQLRQQKPTPAWRRLLAQLQDTLVVLLLAAAAISAVVGTSRATKQRLTKVS